MERPEVAYPLKDPISITGCPKSFRAGLGTLIDSVLIDRSDRGDSVGAELNLLVLLVTISRLINTRNTVYIHQTMFGAGAVALAKLLTRGSASGTGLIESKSSDATETSETNEFSSIQRESSGNDGVSLREWPSLK